MLLNRNVPLILCFSNEASVINLGNNTARYLVSGYSIFNILKALLPVLPASAV